MVDRYHGSLLAEAADQRKHPYLYSGDEVKALRDRLAEALEELWQSR